MLFRKNKLDKLSKNKSAHDRAHESLLMCGAFFDPLMSGSKNERAHEKKVRERVKKCSRALMISISSIKTEVGN